MDQDIERLRWAYNTATLSPDPSTQNGALIAGEHANIRAANTFPMGVRYTGDRLESPRKYMFIEHAERNAILTAARYNFEIFGKTMYVPWFACADCARAIIQSGISKVVGHQMMFDDTPDRWKESVEAGFEMFEEAGVETYLIQGPIPGAPKIRFNGKLWDPSKEIDG